MLSNAWEVQYDAFCVVARVPGLNKEGAPMPLCRGHTCKIALALPSSKAFATVGLTWIRIRWPIRRSFLIR